MATTWLAGLDITADRLAQTTFRDVQHGTENVQFAAATSHTRTITFPRPFAATPNIVIPSITSAAAETDRWIVRVFTLTPTSFGLSLVESTNTSRSWALSRQVQWLAVLL